MKYLIDTNICIYFLNNVPVIVDKLKCIPSDEIAISLITLAELQFGAYNSAKVESNLRRVGFLEETVNIVPLSTEVTRKYAEIKAELRKTGNPVDDFDILIGATAIANNLTLITNNTRHFSNMAGISLENWITG